jgi:hypothetical protein
LKHLADELAIQDELDEYLPEPVDTSPVDAVFGWPNAVNQGAGAPIDPPSRAKKGIASMISTSNL